MLRTRVLSGLVALGFASVASAQTTLYIDFSNSAGASSSSSWNNITGASVTDFTLTDLITSTGATTAIDVLMAGGTFTNSGAGVATGVAAFTSTASGTSHTFVDAAAKDYLASSNATGTLTFSSLNPSKLYTFEFFASRSGALTDKRSATYTLSNGSTTSSVNLEANNNVTGTAVISSFAPSASGSITLTITKLVGNNTANFFYLNAMAVDEITPAAVPEPSAFAALAGVGALGVAGLRRRRRA